MQILDVFQAPGPQAFEQLIRGISIGKLRTYQLYEGFKIRAHFNKLNTETLRKAGPRLWARIQEGDEDFAKDIAQVVLVSHLEMIADILNFLGIPNEGGFFAKDMDPKQYLTEGWQQRVFEQFRGKYPEAILLFYINHLAWELSAADQPFAPAAA